MPGIRAWLAGLTLLVLSMALPIPPSIAGAGPSVATTTRLTARPPFSDNLGMAYDAATRKVVLFLGDAETWSWDGSNWTEEQPPSSPFYRGFEAMVRFGRDVLLFGGVEGIESPTYFNDTWIWDGSTWTQQSPTKRPSPRC